MKNDQTGLSTRIRAFSTLAKPTSFSWWLFSMGEGKARFQCPLIRQHYRIAKYPVTNRQFAAFVKDGGYTEQWRHCWTVAGWQWKGGRSGPEKMGGGFDLDNHPVVNVCWFEAVAFCNWLSERSGQQVFLPSEAQWERASRHTDGREYPWGNAFEAASRCNMDETGINSTSAVGIFPSGKAECEACDMVGNVWEWCGSKWLDCYQGYEERVDETLEGEEQRVVRGGSFYDFGQFVHSAGRFRYIPDFRRRYYGFRVVASPFTSGL